MEETKKHLIIVAGEASGDMHAAHLVQALHRLNPHLSFSGLGGPQMREAGVELFQDLTKSALIGFFEILKHYNEIKKAFNLILEKVRAKKADTVILVDYPGFNLRLAKELKKMNVKVIYYISPQVWAWKKSRVRLISKYVDKMLVLFQFEKDFYAQYDVDVDFVGHPLMDTVQVTTPKERFLESIGYSSEKPTLGILPGSRKKEIETLLPLMLEAAKILHIDFPQMQFLVFKAPTIEHTLIDRCIKESSLPLYLIDDQLHNGVHACDACMVASGTATLETAILERPMVVTYKTSLLTWVLAKYFVKIPNIGLVNVVAEKRIVPECVQFEATPQRIAASLKDILTNEIKIADIKMELRKVKKSLGEPGASQRAAEKILSIV